MLGTSLSGKTTVYKQIKFLHGHRISDNEREDFRATILHNVRTAIWQIYSRIDSSESKSKSKLEAEAGEVCGVVVFTLFSQYSDSTP